METIHVVRLQVCHMLMPNMIDEKNKSISRKDLTDWPEWL